MQTVSVELDGLHRQTKKEKFIMVAAKVQERSGRKSKDTARNAFEQVVDYVRAMKVDKLLGKLDDNDKALLLLIAGGDLLVNRILEQMERNKHPNVCAN